MPNPKDTLLKVKDLPSYDGLRLVDGKLIIPDAEIVLSESASHAPVNTLSKNHLNLGSGENTMYLDPATFTLTKDIPADVEQGTDAEYYKIQFDTEHNRILIYDTDRLEPKIQIDSSGIRLNNSLITGITSQSGSSTSLAASQSMVSGKQNQLTAGSNIRIVNDVISAVLTGVSNIIGEYAPTTAITGADGQLYLQYTEYAEPVIDPETGQPIVDPDTGETVVTSTYSIDKVYGWVDNDWYELNTGSVNLYGTTIPTSDLGENGSIYMQYDTIEGIVQVYGKINNTWYEFGTGGGQVDPELEKRVNELDDTAVRVSTPLTDESGEGLSTISGEPITTKPKNDIVDLIENNVIITQIQSSGTEIAQVKIGDNTAISLYAPSGGGGGSTISITPSLATGTKIADYTIDSSNGSLYAPTPTEVVANPSGSGIADLTKLQVGSTIYNIPSGGSSDPATGYYKETELYSSASSSSSIALNDDYTNYDALIFLNKYNSGGYILDSIVSTTGISEAANNNCQFRIHCGSDSAYIFGAVTNNMQFALTMLNYFVTKVIGINYTKDRIKALIPKMTSNTTPSGTVSASSYAGASFYPYMAFDGANGGANTLYNTWLPSSSESASWIMYEFDSLKTFEELKIRTGGSAQTNSIVFDIEGRKSDNTWENCLKTGSDATFSFPNASFTNATVELNGNEYNAIRLTSHSRMFQANVYGCGIDAIQILGKNVSTT